MQRPPQPRRILHVPAKPAPEVTATPQPAPRRYSFARLGALALLGVALGASALRGHDVTIPSATDVERIDRTPISASRSYDRPPAITAPAEAEFTFEGDGEWIATAVHEAAARRQAELAEQARIAEEARLAEQARAQAQARAALADAGRKEPSNQQVASSAAAGDIKAFASGLVGGGDQFRCLDSLWQKESGWKHTAANPTSSAYGIPQALPGSKMASAGADWRTNPQTQVRWGVSYIEERYGSPCNAWAHSQRKGWY